MRARKKFLLVIPIIAICGCAYSRQITGPNGETLHYINCSGQTMDYCLDKATKICGEAGYHIISAANANVGQTTVINQFGAFSVPQIQREMLIQCKREGEVPKTNPAPGGDQTP